MILSLKLTSCPNSTSVTYKTEIITCGNSANQLSHEHVHMLAAYACLHLVTLYYYCKFQK